MDMASHISSCIIQLHPIAIFSTDNDAMRIYHSTSPFSPKPPQKKRILLITTDVFLFGRMFCAMLKSQHEEFCKPILKVFLCWGFNLLLVI